MIAEMWTGNVIDLGLTFYARDRWEKQLMAGSRDSLPVLKLLADFAEEKLNRELAKTDLVLAMRSMCELHDALEFLAGANPEFKRLHADSEAGMRKLAGACRVRLLRRYLDCPLAEVAGIERDLVDQIRTGTWPTWQRDLEGEIGRCKAAS